MSSTKLRELAFFDGERISEHRTITLWTRMRRFTRLTNGYSMQFENHEAAVALHFMRYNFARVHMSLRVTPAMEAGIADHVWSLEEIVKLTGSR